MDIRPIRPDEVEPAILAIRDGGWGERTGELHFYSRDPAIADAAQDFGERTEPFRRELLAHCYRMLGSADEAEDVVQETYLRAWRSYATFEGRSSLRVWLYRIATNACLTALEHGRRRVLPSALGDPSVDPDGPARPVASDVEWLEVVPSALVAPESEDPAAIVAAKEGLRLALIASLQYLPGRQRAVFLLREVLGFRAPEVASMLGMSVVSVKSALQRARAHLQQVGQEGEALQEPTESRARELLEAYIAGFEDADIRALERALRADAAIELVGTSTWFSGRVTCLRFLRRVIGTPGDWRMAPIVANGQPAAAAYQRAADGTYQAYGIAALDVSENGIARIIVFGGGSELLSRFGLPAQWSK